jgi:hypothetical protein
MWPHSWLSPGPEPTLNTQRPAFAPHRTILEKLRIESVLVFSSLQSNRKYEPPHHRE